MEKKRKKLKATVKAILKPIGPGEPEKAEINVHEADPLYREIRVENVVQGADGEKAKLRQGAPVDVIIEADSNAVVKKG